MWYNSEAHLQKVCKVSKKCQKASTNGEKNNIVQEIIKDLKDWLWTPVLKHREYGKKDPNRREKMRRDFGPHEAVDIAAIWDGANKIKNGIEHSTWNGLMCKKIYKFRKLTNLGLYKEVYRWAAFKDNWLKFTKTKNWSNCY